MKHFVFHFESYCDVNNCVHFDYFHLYFQANEKAKIKFLTKLRKCSTAQWFGDGQRRSLTIRN